MSITSITLINLLIRAGIVISAQAAAVGLTEKAFDRKKASVESKLMAAAPAAHAKWAIGNKHAVYPPQAFAVANIIASGEGPEAFANVCGTSCQTLAAQGLLLQPAPAAQQTVPTPQAQPQPAVAQPTPAAPEQTEVRVEYYSDSEETAPERDEKGRFRKRITPVQEPEPEVGAGEAPTTEEKK